MQAVDSRSEAMAEDGASAAEALPVVPRSYVQFRGGAARRIDAPVVGEIRFTILVDGAELVTLMCSPWELRPLVVGFLYLEGLIDSVDDLELLRVCLEDRLAEVRLARGLPDVPLRKILTSGCTGGVSFGLYLDQVERFRVPDDDRPPAPPERLYHLGRTLLERADLYRQARGIHTTLFAEAGSPQPRYVAEDIGRHNTLDKLQGMALLEGVPTAGGVLVATGRISSEMLFKAAIMGVPMVASRTSPTHLALTVAERLNITVCGYLRHDSMNVYTHPCRVEGAAAA